MGEAIISRGGIGGYLSDETKADLGLPSNATIDDAIQFLALKDNNHGTIIVTLLNPDGTACANQSVSLNSTIENIAYTTNSLGKVQFKTNAGVATVRDLCQCIDLNYENSAVECPVGSVSYITLRRTLKNNSDILYYNTNRNVQFSNYLSGIDVVVTGGGGGGGLSQGQFYVKWDWEGGSPSITAGPSSGIGPYGGNGGNGYSNCLNSYKPNPYSNYQLTIGQGGSGQSASGWSGRSGLTGYFEYGFSASLSIASGYAAAGGTTSFGQIISAIGGSGGANSTGSNMSDSAGQNPINSFNIGSDSLGGSKATYVSGSYGCPGSSDTSWSPYASSSSTSGSGIHGFIRFSNMNYNI